MIKNPIKKIGFEQIGKQGTMMINYMKSIDTGLTNVSDVVDNNFKYVDERLNVIEEKLDSLLVKKKRKGGNKK